MQKGFSWDLSLEMAIAEHGCSFYWTIFVWILLEVIALLDNLPMRKSQIPSRANQISWYFAELIAIDLK